MKSEGPRFLLRRKRKVQQFVQQLVWFNKIHVFTEEGKTNRSNMSLSTDYGQDITRRSPRQTLQIKFKFDGHIGNQFVQSCPKLFFKST